MQIAQYSSQPFVVPLYQSSKVQNKSKERKNYPLYDFIPNNTIELSSPHFISSAQF